MMHSGMKSRRRRRKTKKKKKRWRKRTSPGSRERHSSRGTSSSLMIT
jgi:hypothetical protein